MNTEEAYEFDRQGYIIIKDILDRAQIQSLAAAIDALGRARACGHGTAAAQGECLGC